MTSTEGSSSGGAKGVSIVHDAGRDYSTCGYCKSGRSSSIFHGLWAETLTVDDYQAVVDSSRGCNMGLITSAIPAVSCPSLCFKKENLVAFLF